MVDPCCLMVQPTVGRFQGNHCTLYSAVRSTRGSGLWLSTYTEDDQVSTKNANVTRAGKENGKKTDDPTQDIFIIRSYVYLCTRLSETVP